MRQTLSRGVFAAAAAAGILSLSCSSALADSNAAGVTSDSPGVASGNGVQAPVETPVNLCGNTVHAAAALYGAFSGCADPSCASADESSDSTSGDYDDVTGDDMSASTDESQASDDCTTPATSTPVTPPPTRSSKKPPRVATPHTPSRHVTPPAAHEEPGNPPQLAQTGNTAMLATSAASVALITGGVMLYRRGRTASQR